MCFLKKIFKKKTKLENYDSPTSNQGRKSESKKHNGNDEEKIKDRLRELGYFE